MGGVQSRFVPKINCYAFDYINNEYTHTHTQKHALFIPACLFADVVLETDLFS